MMDDDMWVVQQREAGVEAAAMVNTAGKEGELMVVGENVPSSVPPLAVGVEVGYGRGCCLEAQGCSWVGAMGEEKALSTEMLPK